MKKQVLYPATIIIAFALLQSTEVALGQGVAINLTGESAAPSAMLDITSTTQGILIPRMTQTQRNGIASPASGLLVYQTDGTSGFYYYSGTLWTSLNSITPTGAAGGELAGTYPNPNLATTGVTAGTYGGATTAPVIAVDAKGRITSASNMSISVSPSGTAGGELTGSYPNPGLANTGVVAGTYGGATTSPVIAVNAKGRITSASNTAISVSPSGTAGGDLIGTYPNPIIKNNTITVSKISATGTPSSSTFLSGSGVWSSPGGGHGETFVVIPGGAATGSTSYWNLAGVSYTGTLSTIDRAPCTIIPYDCTFDGLYVNLSYSITSTVTYTVYKNGAPTPMVLTVTGLGTSRTMASNTTNTFSVAAGDCITVKVSGLVSGSGTYYQYVTAHVH